MIFDWISKFSNSNIVYRVKRNISRCCVWLRGPGIFCTFFYPCHIIPQRGRLTHPYNSKLNGRPSDTQLKRMFTTFWMYVFWMCIFHDMYISRLRKNRLKHKNIILIYWNARLCGPTDLTVISLNNHTYQLRAVNNPFNKSQYENLLIIALTNLAHATSNRA